VAAFKDKSNFIYALVNYGNAKKNDQAILKFLSDDYQYEYVNRNSVSVEKQASGLNYK